MSIDARAVLREVDDLESQIQNAQRVLTAMESKGATLQVNGRDTGMGGIRSVPAELMPTVMTAVKDKISEWVSEARRLENSVQVVK